jgi:hypothetical protein
MKLLTSVFIALNVWLYRVSGNATTFSERTLVAPISAKAHKLIIPAAESPEHTPDRLGGRASISQMRSLLVVCQMCADPVDHYHHQGAISHIQPVAPSDKLAGRISCKRAIGGRAKIRFVKAGHDRAK